MILHPVNGPRFILPLVNNYFGSGIDPDAKAFYDRVIADGGTFESMPCLLANIAFLKGINLYNNTSLITTANAYKAGKIYSLKPSNGDGDYIFSRAGTKYRRDSSGTWVSIAANVPALSYPVGGGCPSWLFEPQSTNIVTISNDSFTDGTNGISVSTSVPTNISGVNFRKMTATAVDGLVYIGGAALSATKTGVMCFSIFLKKGTCDVVQVIDQNSTGKSITVNLTTGTIVFQSSGLVCGILDDGNGIYRVYIVQDYTSIGFRFDLYAKVVGDFYFSTAQMESGTFPTSPIVTSGGSVTRLSDDIDEEVTEIGEYEGVFYYEGSFMGSALEGLTIYADSIGQNSITIGRNNGGFLVAAVVGSGSYSGTVGPLTNSNQFYKIAVVYESGVGYSLFVNGVKYAGVSVTYNQPLKRFRIGNGYWIGGKGMSAKPIIFYNTPLSDSEAISLTTI